MPEIMPPTTADEFESDLKNPDFASYVYVGNESDLGWKYARTAYSLIPRLRIYLCKDRSLLKKWCGNRRPAAVSFRWEDDVFKFLNKADAEDLQCVLDTIAEAMQP